MEVLAEYFAELARRLEREVDANSGQMSLAEFAAIVATLTATLEAAFTSIIQEAYNRGIFEFLALYSDVLEADVPDEETEEAVVAAVKLATDQADESTLKDLGRALRIVDEQEGSLREELAILFVRYRRERPMIMAEYERNKARSAAKTQVAEIREKVTGRKMRKRNVNVGDGKVCPICIGNSAAGAIPLRALFPSGHMYSPFHPRCRCWLAFESVT